jgi:hypothetical protein
MLLQQVAERFINYRLERMGKAVMARYKLQRSNLATGGVKPRNTSVKTAQFKACGLLKTNRRTTNLATCSIRTLCWMDFGKEQNH